MVTMYCRFRAGLIACILLVLPGGVFAARVQVDHHIEAGWGGVVPVRGALVPVAVTINNKVGNTSGRIEISQSSGGGTPEVRHVLDFSTPAPSVKRFVVLVRVQSSLNLVVEVWFKDYIRPIRREITVGQENRPIILGLGIPRGYGFGEVRGKYRTVNVPGESLPADPLGLDSVHGVALSAHAFSILAPEQRGALRQWMLTGGTVILTDTPEDETIKAMLRRFIGDPDADLTRTAAIRSGAGILALPGRDSPRGRAFWVRDRALTETIFPEMAEKAQNQYYHGQGYFSFMWRSRRTYGAGAVFMIIFIVGAYICTIGPVDKKLVKWLGRPYLTWVFLPLAAAAFSGIAYLYSSFANVGSMQAAYVDVLDTACGLDTVKGNSLFWVYSAKNATYTIETPVQNAHFSARETAMSAGSAAGVEVMNGRMSKMRARIPVFSSKQLDAAWFMPWEHDITCRGRGSGLRITIPDKLKVRKAFLADRDGLTSLSLNDGELAPRGGGRPWRDVLRDRGSVLRFSYGNAFVADDPNAAQRVGKQLEDYLICLSFPWVTEADNASSNPVGFGYGRDHRERSLDVRGRVSPGRMLLLFLEPDCDLFPVNIKRHFPRTVRMNLLRVQLPDNV